MKYYCVINGQYTNDKLKWKYLPQIYTARFLCSVTSVGPLGRTCARMVLPNTVPLQKPRCSTRTPWCTSLVSEHHCIPVATSTTWHTTLYMLFTTSFHILLGLPSGHFQAHTSAQFVSPCLTFFIQACFHFYQLKSHNCWNKAIRQYQLDAALHCMASGTVINLHMKITVLGLDLRKCRTHTGRP